MKIQKLNLNSVSFSSKNCNIRKADDIQRRARLEFPMLSPSYIDTFYISQKRSNEAEMTTQKLDKKLTKLRKASKYNSNIGISSRLNLTVPFAETLRAIKMFRVGNCSEAAAVTMSALAANGIYDMQRANLFLQTDFVSKKTGKTEFSKKDSLDHTFVLTSMGESSSKEKVVIDSWLGFADSVSSAKEKYKQLFPDSFIKEVISMQRSMLRLEACETGKKIDLNDYDLHVKFVFEPVEMLDFDSTENLDIHANMFYPKLNLKRN